MEATITFATLLISIVASVSAICPRGCSCLSNSLEVVCNGAGLRSIPIMLNPRITSLSLKDNALSTVTLDELSMYTELEYLDLSNNNIVSVQSGSFVQLRKLKVLKLNSNALDTVQPEVFLGPTSLKTLDLSNNGFERIATSVFSDLRSLETLSVSHNKIREISPGAFTGLPSLKQLDLSNNAVTTVPVTALQEVSSLTNLNVAFNRLTTVEEESFAGLNHLQILNLSGNTIDSVSDNAFLGLFNLKELRLDANAFRHVPTLSFRVLSELSWLDIGENPFTELPTSAFEGLGQLKRLVVRQCPKLKFVAMNCFSGLFSLETLELAENPALESIDQNAFESESNLWQVFLNGNNLSSLPQSLLDWDRLSELDLSVNPLACNCELGWLRDVLARIYADDSSSSSSLVAATCAQPPALADKPIRSLSSSDFICSLSADWQNILVTIGLTVSVLALLTTVVCLVLRYIFHRGGCACYNCCCCCCSQVGSNQTKHYSYARTNLQVAVETMRRKKCANDLYYTVTIPTEHQFFLPSPTSGTYTSTSASSASSYGNATAVSNYVYGPISNDSVHTQATLLSNATDPRFRVISQFPVPSTEL